MVTLLNFMTCIYWGQLSHCTVYTDDDIVLQQYSCDNKTAYGATSVFASFLFLLQACYSFAIYMWRGELISEVGLYDEISVHNNSGDASNAYDPSHYNKATAPSADL